MLGCFADVRDASLLLPWCLGDVLVMFQSCFNDTVLMLR